VGLLTNMLILRLDLSGAAAPAEALRRARGAVFSAFDHQDLPFEELLAVLESERENLDRRALAQVMLVLEDAPPLRLELPGLSVEPGALDVDGGAEGMSLSGFDLVVRVVRQGEGMVIHLRYKEGTLDDVEAKRLAGQVRGALELLAGAPPAVTQQDDVLERYERDGFAIFRNVIDPDLIAEAREHVAWLLRRYPDLRPEHLHHPLIRNDACWVRLVTDPRLLRIAERFLGPDLACFTAHYICKPARGGMPVLWHQDGAYWKLEPMQALTVWLAIDESSPENGCLRVVPGSHRLPLQPIEVRTSPRNMLCSTIGADVDVSTAVDLVLQPGDVSIHHPHVVHGSEANGSDRRRCGLDIGYIPTSVAIRNTGLYTNPLLVRGSPVPGVNVYRPWPEYSPETSIPFAGCEAWNDRARQVNERHGFVHTSREDVLVETARIIRRLEEGTVKS
jgi:ectoine hydroxylase-related dioxygenase (phytanoyl-CoA dioxygenase family)